MITSLMWRRSYIMGNLDLVAKLWGLCNVLRDDGITYHQYVTELTYILFLKMLKETDGEKNIKDSIIKTKKEQDNRIEIKSYSWDKLAKMTGIELKKYYNRILNELGENCIGRIREIYRDARSNIDEPKNLEKIIAEIDRLDWYSAKEDGFGDIYEGLLEKNANEKKSGAGQYFTPRVLIDVMTNLIAPQLGEICNDPACGTFGFMIAADKFIKENNDMLNLSVDKLNFQKNKAFTGCELVSDTHRLALMNAIIHGIDGDIVIADTLSSRGKEMKNFDVVLTNPPFGTKKSGERATRDDLNYPSSNKQLNFLQHIYTSLKVNGKARAAVVLPDNVLFADGDGALIRADLMDRCNLHTILRLPTGIFYAQGVKTNVFFFTRGKVEENNTKEVWFYDMRTNINKNYGKTNPLKSSDFDGFVAAYVAPERINVKDERFTCFTREQIKEKNNNLDLGLIRDDSLRNYKDLQDPIDSGEEIIADLEEAVDLIMSVIKELKSLCGGDK